MEQAVEVRDPAAVHRQGLPPTNGWGDLIGNGTVVPMRHCDKKLRYRMRADLLTLSHKLHTKQSCVDVTAAQYWVPRCLSNWEAMAEWLKLGALSLLFSTLLTAVTLLPVLLFAH
jgi:hypothetical protein